MSTLRLTIARFKGAKILAGPGVAIFAVLIVLSFRFGIFPFWYETLSAETYWWMSIATLLGILISVFLHDLAHLLSEVFLGCKPTSMNFYFFGGVPTRELPSNRKVEWKVAFAGPIFTLALGLVLFSICLVADRNAMPLALVGVLFHLAAANVTLAFFNFLPFFPLDGGRVLRSMLWRRGRTFIQANSIASRGGFLLALMLLSGGLALVFNGKVLTGGWIATFGLILGVCAQINRESVTLRTLLKGRKARELMNCLPVVVPASLSLDKLASEYFDKYHFRVFPVVRENHIFGFVTEKHLGKVSPELWSEYRVGEVATMISKENSVSPQDSALKAFELIKEKGLRMVLVVEKERLAGVVTAHDIWDYASASAPSDSKKKDVA